MAEHIYCGSGKEKTFSDGGSIVTVTLNIDEILAQYNAYGFTTNAGKRTIKVKVSPRMTPGKYGETHSVEIDTWKPDNQNRVNQSAPSRVPSKQSSARNDAPPEFKDDFPDSVPF